MLPAGANRLRTRALSSAAALAAILTIFLPAPSTAQYADCPGIVDTGIQTKIDLIGTVECDASSCPQGAGGFLEDIVIFLCNSGLPASCGKCECCRSEAAAVATGTDAVLFGPDPDSFCQFGGRGQALGEAALCLLRDLAEPAGGNSEGGPGVQISDSFSVGIGDASVNHRVGFISFDAATLQMTGYHSLGFCVPALGCIEGQNQEFTATLVHQTEDGVDCGDYRLHSPWLLSISAEEKAYNLGIEVGPIYINTPIGTIEIRPRLDYESNLQAVTSPFVGGNSQKMRTTVCADVETTDVSTSDQVMAISEIMGVGQGLGMDSSLSLGGRNPDLNGGLWEPLAVPYPQRPDFDFTSAREDEEKRPNTRFHGGVIVTYGLEAILAQLGIDNLNFPPLALETLDLFITSDLDAAFSSQFQIATEELSPDDVPDCSEENFTRLSMQSSVASAFRLKLDAGVNIVIVLDLGFWEKRFEFHPRGELLNLTPDPAVDTVVGPEASVKMFLDEPPTATSDYSTFTDFSLAPQDGNAFVDDCLTLPPPPEQAPPQPSLVPGDPADLLELVQIPCNICIYLPEVVVSACVAKSELIKASTIPADYDCGLAFNGMPCTDPNCREEFPPDPVYTNGRTLVQGVPQDAFPPALQWSCDKPEKSGCFDLCTYDATAEQPLVVAQSAVDKLGAYCRDGLPGDFTVEKECTENSDCDDVNPCTGDFCLGAPGAKTCSHLAASGFACNDGFFCNGADTCLNGYCSAHAGNPCFAAGDCCDDGADVCLDSCPTSPCDGLAVNDPCDDGSACSVDDKCVATFFGLYCRGDDAITCSSGSACLTSRCQDVDGVATCESAPNGACPDCGDGNLDVGELCDDGNRESGDGCDANCTETGCGNSVADPSEGCDDGNQDPGDGCDFLCGVETCWTCNGDGFGSCELSSTGTPCEDYDTCTHTDQCTAGICAGTTSADGTPCNDGSPCSLSDVCQAGACIGDPPDCDDGSPCTNDYCDDFTATCQHQTIIPTFCKQAASASLVYKNSSEDGKDSLLWKWKKGAELLLSDVADPTTTASYQLCITHSGGAIAHAQITGGTLCEGNPCWSAISDKGFKYKDKADPKTGGLSGITLKSGELGKSGMTLKAKGLDLYDPSAPFNEPVFAVLTNMSNFKCVMSVFSGATQNDAEGFKAAFSH